MKPTSPIRRNLLLLALSLSIGAALFTVPTAQAQTVSPSAQPTELAPVTDGTQTTPEPIQVVVVDAGTGEPVAEADITPSWVGVVIVVLGGIVTALSGLLSAGAYAALRQSLKTGVQIAELLSKSTPSKVDDEFVKQLKAALKLEIEAEAQAQAQTDIRNPRSNYPE